MARHRRDERAEPPAWTGPTILLPLVGPEPRLIRPYVLRRLPAQEPQWSRAQWSRAQWWAA